MRAWTVIKFILGVLFALLVGWVSPELAGWFMRWGETDEAQAGRSRRPLRRASGQRAR